MDSLWARRPNYVASKATEEIETNSRTPRRGVAPQAPLPRRGAGGAPGLGAFRHAEGLEPAGGPRVDSPVAHIVDFHSIQPHRRKE